mmetsp:Transcript_11005/g.20939  ORF Transcript_11005/g.20939 Transcript_11005/m.20939 type:complete len:690 (-) Transcript_11005:219-2288(-)
MMGERLFGWKRVRGGRHMDKVESMTEGIVPPPPPPAISFKVFQETPNYKDIVNPSENALDRRLAESVALESAPAPKWTTFLSHSNRSFQHREKESALTLPAKPTNLSWNQPKPPPSNQADELDAELAAAAAKVKAAPATEAFTTPSNNDKRTPHTSRSLRNSGANTMYVVHRPHTSRHNNEQKKKPWGSPAPLRLSLNAAMVAKEQQARQGYSNALTVAPPSAAPPVKKRGASSNKAPRQPPIGKPLRVFAPPFMNAPDRTEMNAGPVSPTNKNTRKSQLARIQDYMYRASACKRAGRRRAEANAYYSMGVVYDNMKEYLKAIECYKAFQTVLEATEDKFADALAHNSIGVSYYNLANQTGGGKLLQNSSPRAVNNGSGFDEGGLDSREGKGRGSSRNGDKTPNFGAYRAKRQGSPPTKSCVTSPQYAKPAEQDAFSPAVPNRNVLGLENLSNTALVPLDFSSALTTNLNRLNLTRKTEDEIPDIEMQIMRYRDLARWHHSQHRDLADLPGQFIAHCNLGLVCKDSGFAKDSARHHQHALRAAIRMNSLVGQSIAVGNLGLTGFAHNDLLTAKVCMERHLELSTHLRDHEGQKIALQKLGEIASHQGNYDQATTFFSGAKKLAQDKQDTKTNASASVNMGVAIGNAEMEYRMKEVADKLKSGLRSHFRENSSQPSSKGSSRRSSVGVSF